ncbi:MAG: hypothetical protein IT353_04625 [Gemmatimonadaceae bacterium]|nr:hypothetical protein [Gemmatimonadaceae bacterium]
MLSLAKTVALSSVVAVIGWQIQDFASTVSPFARERKSGWTSVEGDAARQAFPVVAPKRWTDDPGGLVSGTELVGLLAGPIDREATFRDSVWVAGLDTQALCVTVAIRSRANTYGASAEYEIPAAPSGAFLQLAATARSPQRRNLLAAAPSTDLAVLATTCRTGSRRKDLIPRHPIASWTGSRTSGSLHVPAGDTVFALVSSGSGSGAYAELRRGRSVSKRPCKRLDSSKTMSVSYQFVCALGVQDSLVDAVFRVGHRLGGEDYPESTWRGVIVVPTKR